MTFSGERCDDTHGLIIVLTKLGTRAHCLQMSLLACLDHLACCHFNPSVHWKLVVLVLAVGMEQLQDWNCAKRKSVTIMTRNMSVSIDAIGTKFSAACSTPTIAIFYWDKNHRGLNGIKH